MTDSGLRHFQTVVEIIDRADQFDGCAGYSDVWTAWKQSVENWLSSGQQPESTDEILQSITDLVGQNIKERTILVPLIGIELEGIDAFELGSMTIIREPRTQIESEGVSCDGFDYSPIFDTIEHEFWLKGTVRGTSHRAEKKFAEQAALATGILAVVSGASYELNANGFRIGTIMSAEDAPGHSVWFSWTQTEKSLGFQINYPRGQSLPLNTVLDREPEMARLIDRAAEIVSSSERTELEEAIVKAIFWYSDANRDRVLVMKLVKYWSCVEAFFSFEREGITRAVSVGLASILLYGGFQFCQDVDYRALRKQIVDLYDRRSDASHKAFYEHTTELDVAQLSQWAAWMIFNMVDLVERGYTTLDQVKSQAERVDRLEEERR